jgi:hypothetical protein
VRLHDDVVDTWATLDTDRGDLSFVFPIWRRARFLSALEVAGLELQRNPDWPDLVIAVHRGERAKWPST